jgi:hypothetical protein
MKSGPGARSGLFGVCQFPEMCRLGDQRKDFPLTRRLPRQVTRRILRCLQAFPVDCPRAKLDLLARLSARTCNESPHYGKCLLIKAEAISLKSLQESGPTSLHISGSASNLVLTGVVPICLMKQRNLSVVIQGVEITSIARTSTNWDISADALPDPIRPGRGTRSASRHSR